MTSKRKDKKKKWAMFCITLFLIYIMLSTFYLMSANYSYRHMHTITLIGELIKPINYLLRPGSVLGFLLWSMVGENGIFVGQAVTFLAGAIIILHLFNFSLSNLVDGLDRSIKKGPWG